MEYSAFCSYGSLEYSSELPDAEKIYNSMVASYTHPKTGLPVVDMTVGSYHESKVYARAMALADANAATRRAGNQEDPLKATENLPIFEADLRIAPKPTASIDARRAAVAARRIVSRGNRREALYDGLTQILGTALIAVRPIASSEATLWPNAPRIGPGVFGRASQPAKIVRLLDPVAQTGKIVVDSYSETNKDTDGSLVNGVGGTYSAYGQSFAGVDGPLYSARFYLQRVNSGVGNAVAKIYAHSGTFGVNGVPTGTPLATSSPLDISTLSNAVYVLVEFLFPGAPLLLSSALKYFAVIEYSAGSGANSLAVGLDVSAPTAHGSVAHFTAGAWTSDAQTYAACFYVHTTLAVAYQSWDVTRPDLQLAKGDVLCVQPENLGLAEKVTVVSVEGVGASRVLRAIFTRAHDVGASASTGPVPIWWSNTGHLLIVVTAAAALNAALCGQVDEFLMRHAKGGTTWSIVEPTTGGASTIGPFTLGLSPLGAVTVGSTPLVVAPASPTLSSLFGPSLAHLWSTYDHGTQVWSDTVGGADATPQTNAPAEAVINGHHYPVFNGVNTGMQALSDFSTLDNSADWCIFAAFKTNTGSGFGAIIDRAFQFFVELGSGAGGHAAFASGYAGGGGSLSGGVVDDNAWHRIIVTVTATAGILYVDGVSVATSTIPNLSNIANSSDPYLLGVRPNGVVTDSSIAIIGMATRGVTVPEVATLDAILLGWV